MASATVSSPPVKVPSVTVSFALIHRVIQIAVEYDIGGAFVHLERTAGDLRLVPVEQSRLCHISKGAAFDGQLAVVVVLDGVQTTGECTALNGQHRRFTAGVLGTILPAVLQQAGKLAGLLHRHTVVDGHGAVVDNRIVGVIVRLIRRSSRILAAVKRAAVEVRRAFIPQCRTRMGDIIHRTGAHNRRVP